MEIARAKGAALGDVAASRIRARAEAGQPVTKMDYAKAGAKAVGKGVTGAFGLARKGIQAMRGGSKSDQQVTAARGPESSTGSQNQPFKVD
jgi:hypothetical protein